jgi:hypothetical protein
MSNLAPFEHTNKLIALHTRNPDPTIDIETNAVRGEFA